MRTPKRISIPTPPEKQSTPSHDARAATEHVVHLQRLTSALSEATTLAEIGNVVTTNLREMFAADAALLAIAVEDGEQIEVVSRWDVPGGQLPGVRHVFSADAPLPLAAAY